MALVTNWFLASFLACNAGTLFLKCVVFAQPQPLAVNFDEPDIKLAKLNFPTSLSCFVYGDLRNITMQNSAQIVQVKDGSETVVFGAGSSPPSRYQFTTNLQTFPPSKLQILLKILSVKTDDDAQFICKFFAQDGTVYESSVKLQVVMIPEQIVCGKRKLGNTIEVTCTMVVYPTGNCNLQLANSGDSPSSAVSYEQSVDDNGVYTTTCTIQGPTSRGFRVAFSPSVPNPKDVTTVSDVISDGYSGAFVYSFEANDKSSSVVRVDMGDELELECKVRGSAPSSVYLYRVRPGEVHKRLLRHANKQISYEIDRVTCKDEGDYYCMAGYEQNAARQITVQISSCGGSTLDPTNFEYKDLSRNLIIICTTMGIGGLALIVSVIICALCCIRRRRARQARTAANRGIILSVPTAPDYEHVYTDSLQVETSLQMNPPPYSTICDKEGIHDVAPPPYPGVIDKNNSHPVGQIGQETPTPPPYTRK